MEKGYQTLFENVFKPYFRLLGIEGEHAWNIILNL